MGAGAARSPSQLPLRARAAARARQDPRPRPHHGRRLPRQHPARPARRAWARASARSAWAVPPLFRLIQRGRRRRRRRDVPHLQHGHRHGGGRRSRGPPRRRALARAARRDELRHRLGGARAPASSSSETAGAAGSASSISGRGIATCRPSSTPQRAGAPRRRDRGRGVERRSARRASSGRARAGIPATVRDHRGRTREDYDREVVALLRGARASISSASPATCGCSPRVSSRPSPGRILNVHPSLLPAFPGLDAQRQAWDHGVKVSGATVHLVDEGLDSRPHPPAGGRARARTTTREERSPPASSRPSIASTRARCALVLEGRYRAGGPPRAAARAERR